jgi:hypothetical protein
VSDDQPQHEVDALDLTDELAKKYDPERMLKMVAKRAGRGDALDASLRQKYEKRYGVDLGHVRIFTGEFAEDFNRRHNSYAVTVGNTGMVMMGNSPDKSMASASGQALLAHELAHVAQQARRGGGGAGAGGLHRKALEEMPFTHDDELEAEEHELAAYQQAMGAPLTADQEHAKMSGKAREQSNLRLEQGIEKIKQRVVDMMGDAAKTQMMRNGSSRRA